MALNDKQVFDLNELMKMLAVSQEFKQADYFSNLGTTIQAFGTSVDGFLAPDGVTGTDINENSLFKILIAIGADASVSSQQVATTGTVVGDKVIWVLNLTDSSLETANFESTITVNDAIVQSSTDLTAKVLFIGILNK